MGENTVTRIQELGQSVWIDHIRRSMLTTGELGALVRQGITGLTSNPTIFEKAISGSTDYDEALLEMSRAGKSPAEVFEALAVEDIQDAADILRGVYDRTDGADGYVSIELPPPLAHDRRATLAEARRLSASVGRPNALIKVPATPEGIKAVRTLIAEGINVNVTLIFSLDSYRTVMEAYLRGLEQRASQGGDLRVASVASFFVSRVDSAVDPLLRALAAGGDASALDLLGTAAVANARAAYALFKTEFGGERFASLRAKGARVQRPLWASTSTKDPAYSDTMYVDSLIGPDTVNTMPPQTLDAVLDHGVVAPALDGTGPSAEQTLDALTAAGINMAEVTEKLLRDGVAAFADSYDAVLASVESKCGELAQAAS
ncbi:MAG: transaldolase [Chloroflexi bacterium]|nr:transaldolase [Chloroflexota bacterium]